MGRNGLTFARLRHILTYRKWPTRPTKKTQAQANGTVLSRNELLDLHKRLLAEVRKMTPEEGFKDLIDSGIYTPEGKLAKEYGG